MQITVRLDKRQLEKALRRAPVELRTKAYVAGINRTATQSRNKLSSYVAKEGKLPVRLVKEGLPVKKANYRKLEANIIPTGKRIPLMKLGRAHQTATGARAGRHFRKGAFMAMMNSGHIGMFKRRTRKRLPIIEQTVSGIRAVASRSNVIRDIEQFANAKLLERVEHEIRYRMKRLGLR